VADKFGLNYVLNVQRADKKGEIEIKPPFTLDFNIQRLNKSSNTRCSIRIYNLSKDSREQIRYDFTRQGDFRGIKLKAGYGNNLATIFSGVITQAWSVRESVNQITQIEASFSPIYSNVKTDNLPPFKAGTTYTSIIKALASKIPFVTIGAISDYPTKITKDTPYEGDIIQIIQDLSGDDFFIDNSKVYVLTERDVLKLPLKKINSANGLLATPTRQQSLVDINIIFEPFIRMSQKIELESITSGDSKINGMYKVYGIKHKGVISGAVTSSCVTSLSLQLTTNTVEISETP